MYCFKLWRMKRYLLTSGENVNVVNVWKHLRIKGIKIGDDMQIIVHKLSKDGTKWFYTNYQLTKQGDMIERRSGQYPASFCAKK